MKPQRTVAENHANSFSDREIDTSATGMAEYKAHFRPASENQTGTRLRRWHLAFAAACLTGALFYGSWLPFRFREISFADGWRLFGAILKVGWSWPYSRQDVAVNVLAGMPLGFLLLGSILFRERRLPRVVVAAGLSLAFSTGISLIAEAGQVWIDGRVPSPRDIAAQIAGAVVGNLLWLLAGQWFADELDDFFAGRRRSTRLQALLNLYVVGFFIWSLLPLDPVTTLGEFAQKLIAGEIELVPFGSPYRSQSAMWQALFVDTVLYVPVGVWATLTTLRREAAIRNAWSAFTLAALVCIGIEAAQLAIKGRYSSTTDLLCGITGSLLGVGAARICLRLTRQSASIEGDSIFKNPGFWSVLAVAYAGLLLIVFWTPFEITQQTEVINARLRAFADIPFRRLQESGSDVGALFTVIRDFTWFVPLGVVSAVAIRRVTDRTSRRRVLGAVAIIGISSLALLIELGHVVMPSRVADLTEVLIRVGGGVSGLVMGVCLVGTSRDGN